MQELGDGHMTNGMALGRQTRANWRLLLQVHRSGDMGSPRVSGSINASNAWTNWGSCSTNVFRPAPVSPYSFNAERWLSKALDSPIEGRTREPGKTTDAGNTPSSQLLCIDGSDKVLLSLIQVRKQQTVFLLEFRCCAHTDSVTRPRHL